MNPDAAGGPPPAVSDDMNPDELVTLETTEAIGLPAAGLYVNVDVNDLLVSMSEEEMFALIGKLKDLLAP